MAKKNSVKKTTPKPQQPKVEQPETKPEEPKVEEPVEKPDDEVKLEDLPENLQEPAQIMKAVVKEVRVSVHEQVRKLAMKRNGLDRSHSHRQQMKADKAKRDREARALANAQTPYGLSPEVTAKLQDAAKKVHEHPKYRELVEKASVAQRVQLAKKSRGIVGGEPPEFFMGIPTEEYNKIKRMSDFDNVQSELPPRMTEIRRTAEAQKNTNVGQTKKKRN